ncbi:MAG TPA: NADP-dependent oxidoreductase [Steroidobacteraceae bacterium]|nr:NADP-dependent oxidoreductase [Steroidobacteraceae bacterium]
MPVNHRITLARVPSGLPVPGDFGRDAIPAPSAGPGQLLLRTLWLSLDPYLRNVMKGHTLYGTALKPGEVMFGEVVAEVLESRHPGFAAGEYVLARTGWQEYAVSDGRELRKVDPAVGPLAAALGVLGMPGLTGYAGLVYLGEPKPGQTVLVSAATGPVGCTVGQVARLTGARAVGIAGSEAKCRYAVEELGFASCLNHRAGDLAGQIRRACPDGVDVYFDNVGDAVLVAALANLAMHARVVLCGMIDSYSRDEPPSTGPWLGPVVRARATVKGLVVYDHFHRMAELQKVVGGWIREGCFKYREDVTEGLEGAPEAFCRLMRGENFGKSLVRVATAR